MTIFATPHAYPFSTPYNSHIYPFWVYSLFTVLSTALCLPARNTRPQRCGPVCRSRLLLMGGEGEPKLTQLCSTCSIHTSSVTMGHILLYISVLIWVGCVIWSGSNRGFFLLVIGHHLIYIMGYQTDFVFSLLRNRNQYIQKQPPEREKTPKRAVKSRKSNQKLYQKKPWKTNIKTNIVQWQLGLSTF